MTRAPSCQTSPRDQCGARALELAAPQLTCHDQTPVTETNYLYELDRITQEIAQAVLEAQKLPGASFARVPHSDRTISAHSSPFVDLMPRQLAFILFLLYSRSYLHEMALYSFVFFSLTRCSHCAVAARYRVGAAPHPPAVFVDQQGQCDRRYFQDRRDVCRLPQHRALHGRLERQCGRISRAGRGRKLYRHDGLVHEVYIILLLYDDCIVHE